MKVLIVRFSSIGDIVLTTPVIRCIKQQIPDVSLHYITKPSFSSVLLANPYIDKLHVLKDDIDITIEDLKKENFDYVVDLHKNIRSRRIIHGISPVKSASFPKLNFKKWLLVNFKINLMPDVSIVDRYFEAVKYLKVQNDGKGLEYFTPDGTEVTENDIPMSHWAGYVGCVIGGSYNTKKFPIEKWQEFAKVCPYPLILLGGPEDRDFGRQIAEQDSIKIYNACGKFNINESAVLVSKAKVVVTNDTGLMHIAAAYHKPIVSIWGNTSPVMGMAPYFGTQQQKTTRIFYNKQLINNKLTCQPCSKLGYKKCPRGHFKCMYELDVDEINFFVKKIFQNSQP